MERNQLQNEYSKALERLKALEREEITLSQKISSAEERISESAAVLERELGPLWEDELETLVAEVNAGAEEVKNLILSAPDDPYGL